MAAKIFEYPLKIREGHLDTFGHVNNAVYLQILEEARWDILNQNGWGLDVIRSTKLGPVILEVNLKFKREMTLGQTVNIRTQLRQYQGKIGILDQTIVNAAGEVCCEAAFTMALFDTKARKLVDPTPEWLKAISE